MECKDMKGMARISVYMEEKSNETPCLFMSSTMVCLKKGLHTEIAEGQ